MLDATASGHNIVRFSPIDVRSATPKRPDVLLPDYSPLCPSCTCVAQWSAGAAQNANNALTKRKKNILLPPLEVELPLIVSPLLFVAVVSMVVVVAARVFLFGNSAPPRSDYASSVTTVRPLLAASVSTKLR